MPKGLLLSVVGVIFLAVSGDAIGQEPPRGRQAMKFTRVEQIRNPGETPAGAELSATLQGIVHSPDPAKRQFYIADESGAILVRIRSGEQCPASRAVVEVRGRVVTLPEGGRAIHQSSVHTLDLELPNVVKRLNASEITKSENWHRLVEVEGVVRQITVPNTGVVRFYVGGRREVLRANFLTAIAHVERYQELIDADVRIRGILRPSREHKDDRPVLELSFTDLQDLTVTRAPNPSPFQIPNATLAELDEPNDHRTRIEGVVGDVSDALKFSVVLEGKRVSVNLSTPTPIRVGDRVAVLGFPRKVNEDLRFDHAIARLVDEPNATTHVLSSVREIRQSASHTNTPTRARLRGFISAVLPLNGIAFLQDATNGIQLRYDASKHLLAVRDWVELEGTVRWQDGSVEVSVERFQKLGGYDLPAAPSIRVNQGIDPSMSGDFVQVEGVLLGFILVPEGARLVVGVHGRNLEVFVPDADGHDEFSKWIDSRIRVMGAVATNRFGRPVMFNCAVISSGLDTVRRMHSPAAGDPFQLPRISLIDLSTSYLHERGSHRVRVCAPVTFAAPSMRSFFLQDGDLGLWVNAQEAPHVEVGDEVEVVGFPFLNESNLVSLCFSEIRFQKKGTPVAPTEMHPFDARQISTDAKLLRMDGKLVEIREGVVDWHLVLRAIRRDNKLPFVEFLVSVPKEWMTDELHAIPIGSILQVTGVCSHTPIGYQRSHFRLVARSASDVVVLSRPPWFDAETALWLFSIMGTVLFAAMLWLILLRVRIAQQTAIIRQKIASEAKLETRFRQLVTNADDMIVITDAQGNITALNPAGERLLNVSQEKAIGKSIKTFLAPPQQELLFEGWGHASAKPIRITLDQRILEIILQPVRDGDQLVEVHGIGRDITERRRLEERLVHSQKMDALGRLAGGVAHDFNNLLTVINGYGNMLASRHAEGTAETDMIRQILRAGERATALTRQLLAFGRKQPAETRDLDLNHLLRETLNLLKPVIWESVEVRMDLEPNLPKIHADPALIEQAFINLIVNARDAMPSGGQLSVATGKTEDGNFIRVDIGDTGVGMTEDVLDRCFEPFFTTKEVGKGTGLGLSMVYGIVQELRGRIHVSSKLNQGSTFRIELPISEQTASWPTPTQPAITPREGTVRMLLVEDDPLVRQLAQEILQRGGYVVDLASDAQAAMTILRADTDHTIQILLTDYLMPGASGHELATEACQLRPDLPMIIMSGYSDSEALHVNVAEKMVSYLAKPFTSKSLLDAVDKAASRLSPRLHVA